MWEAPFCGEASVSVGALAARAPHPSPSARVSRGNRVKPCCSCHGRDPRGERKDKRRRRHPGASFRPFALSCLGYGMTMDYSRGVPRHPWCFPPPFFWCPVILHACQIARLCICVYVYVNPGERGGVGRTEEAGVGTDEGNEDAEGCTGQ